jgi:propanol-preferring alcohol dehydrogenase
MRAMRLRRPSPAPWSSAPLEAADIATPEPASGELLVYVSVCGVCRTDLDVVEGRIIAPRYPVIPGHQVVGRVAAVGRDVADFREGDRVGIAWIHSACGQCRWCRAGNENLCPGFRSTGCDANGGYAEYAVVPAEFAYAMPPGLADIEAAPLLCAGAVGMRSLRLTNLIDGEPLGLVGFGASAHLVLQIARHRYPRSPVYVFARNPDERAFARELGATWTGDLTDDAAEPLAAIIDTTPAWEPVVSALARLAPGGRLVINAIRKARADQDALLRLDFPSHLWMEREIKSVANVTRDDVRQMLTTAVEIDLHPTVEELPLEEANIALARLAAARAVRGATALRIRGSEHLKTDAVSSAPTP